MAKKNRKDNLGETSMEEEKVEVIIEEEVQPEQTEIKEEQSESVKEERIVEEVQSEEIKDEDSPTQADMHAYLTELRKKVNNETATDEEIEIHTRLSHLLQR